MSDDARPTTAAGDEATQAPILEVSKLGVEFETRKGVARVLERVGFSLRRGETLGLVGESGCGKSMTALAIMRLIPSPPGRITDGQVRFDGRDLMKISEAEMREVRGNRVSMIFQEPMTSLNPVFTVGDQIAETVRLHQNLDKAAARARALEMLEAVGIPAAKSRIDEYPHQFSGGMRQRVMIAMALACSPDVLIADEPTTALDVTVQAQIFDLISDLRDKTGSAVILITHDMGAVAEMTDRVAVMYAGRIVEEGSVFDVLDEPLHPYTQGLIACAPGRRTAAAGEPLEEIPGTVPSLLERRGGCAFADRCRHVESRCRLKQPPQVHIGADRHVLCWLYDDASKARAGGPR
ncbi:MAG: ABC transporter ATP-binding protein [Burkholderiaceae bacterium]|nr:ABC transporter ATP-binding protein [Burkholderiaceae bacterium]